MCFFVGYVSQFDDDPAPNSSTVAVPVIRVTVYVCFILESTCFISGQRRPADGLLFAASLVGVATPSPVSRQC